MRCTILCVMLIFATTAQAECMRDAARLTQQERAWLTGFVNAAHGQPPRAPFRRCGCRLSASCQGYISESLRDARMPQVPGRLVAPRRGAPVETAQWQELRDRWQALTAAASDACGGCHRHACAPAPRPPSRG
jgi:hypothetical protein